ncbi:MCE family protein [Rhizobium rhizogenes]|uniref:ABC transporter protein n=2 Tax=Rhizobium rhizogenes TaxID=359 RepID=B9JFW2_RHIR8|nr:MlaD family protein [Rhizobium rhizogenes]ACM26802.1 ABC transporter protein [Rhizobium rhizogenes K84]KAA6489799.1 MCE family protein [Agrobacterium sp. ICMP 7243]OCJ05920.1 organic solvent ABC transporter substrate-binding protein [Agrobacterium sp. 13-626]OCJ25870.1 organic solvent ABC transporter substrate-binding protein [Agrobacterium sp. B131/95]MDJ1634749.1 MlaD family protein [Rhizobium rhizogenes]
METKANYTIVGFFTLLVIAAAFGFVYWMAEYGRGGPMVELVVRIPGSANGLSVGSPVRFNGIQVGSVQGLSIDADDPNYSLAFTEVRADAPVYTSTKAILEIQGLTGAAYIELSGGRNGDENILKRSVDTGKRAVLLADQSSVTNLLNTADKILNRANDTIGDIQGFVSDSRAPLTDTVRNAQTFSKALSDNSDNIDKFLASMGQLSDTFKNVSTRIDSTLEAVEKLVRAVDANKINEVVNNANKITANVADATTDLKATVAAFKQTADTYNAFGQKAQQTLDRVDAIVAQIDPAKLKGSVDDITQVTKDARAAVTSIREVANSVAARQQDIDQTIANARSISEKLNSASGKVDGVLSKVDSLLGSGDTQSLFAEAKDTLTSFKKMADNLNARIGPIADNLQKFSSSGLSNVQTLINDMRGTVDNLNSTITNFDRNPQRLLFGGDTVKQYDGRARR